VDILNYLKDIVVFFFGSGMQIQAFQAMDWIRKALMIMNTLNIVMALVSCLAYQKVYVHKPVWRAIASFLTLFCAGFFLLEMMMIFHYYGNALQLGMEPLHRQGSQVAVAGLFVTVLNLVLYLNWIIPKVRNQRVYLVEWTGKNPSAH
jgi:hypothetical protein